VREGGASVDARDEEGKTPLHWATSKIFLDRLAAVDLLVSLGADVNARNAEGKTPIFGCAWLSDVAVLRRLLARGASADVADDEGCTPLMTACWDIYVDTRVHYVTMELARRSSPETRRAVIACPDRSTDGYSTVDLIVNAQGTLVSWQKELIAELLVSGAPVLPRHASKVLPVAVSHGLPLAGQKEAELRRRRAELCSSWHAHEAFVGLALDVGELRAAEREVAEKRRRVLELEKQLLALGAGTESSSGSDEEESDEDDESDSGSESETESDEQESAGNVDESDESDEDESDGDDDDDKERVPESAAAAAALAAAR
jgi:hypothetical protein